MNLAKLKKNIGDRFRLRPTPTITSITRRSEVDDLWVLEDVGDGYVKLRNERTAQPVTLARSHVRQYDDSTPGSNFRGFLQVEVWIDITTPEPTVEPILTGAPRALSIRQQLPLRARLVLLLDRVNPEILQRAKSPRRSVSVLIGAHNLQRLNELRDEPGFDELMRVVSNGNVCFGSGHRIHGHVQDLDESGSLHGLVLEFRDPLVDGSTSA